MKLLVDICFYITIFCYVLEYHERDPSWPEDSATGLKSKRRWGPAIGHVLKRCLMVVAWSADSHYIVSGSKDSTLKLWCPSKDKQAQHTLPGHEDEVYAIDWSPDGTQVASGSKDRTIKVWHN